MTLQVRPFQLADTGRLRCICCETAAERPFLPWIEEPRLAPGMFLDPYLEVESESCFVAEVNGHIVGYLVGTQDSMRFRERLRIGAQSRMLRLLKIQMQGVVNGRFRHFLSHRVLASTYSSVLFGRLRKKPESGGYFDIHRYPAHCHLQVVPEARGKGAGLALLLQFYAHLKASRIPGAHGSVVEQAGRETLSAMLLAMNFRVVHEERFTARDVKTLIHPGVWQERVLVREL